MYDSRPETYNHIHHVQMLMNRVVKNLLARALNHDQSKLCSPELEALNEITPKLEASTYGSEEYHELMKTIKPYLDYHCATNDHHPECKGGIKNMSLLSILEMLVDWKAATLRHKDGDLRESIELNQKRFGYQDDFKQILLNTAEELGML